MARHTRRDAGITGSILLLLLLRFGGRRYLVYSTTERVHPEVSDGRGCKSAPVQTPAAGRTDQSKRPVSYRDERSSAGRAGAARGIQRHDTASVPLTRRRAYQGR